MKNEKMLSNKMKNGIKKSIVCCVKIECKFFRMLCNLSAESTEGFREI